jgi:hypothetical protein
MEKCRWAIGTVLALVLLCSASSSPAADDKPPSDQKAGSEAVFDMKQVSLYDQKESENISPYAIFNGLNAMLGAEPAKEVKAYPKLNSKQPLYGSIVFNNQKPGSPTKFYFVIDESAPAEEPKEKAAKAEADKAPANPPKRHYDRLYIDLNGDLDLTNDAAVSPMKTLPKNYARFVDGPQNAVIFDTVSVPLGEDPKAKGPTIRVLPVVMCYGKAGRIVFTAGSACKGEVKVGKQAYSALLIPQGAMLTQFDGPQTQLILTPINPQKPVRSYPWLNTLAAIRQAEGEYYKLSATASGDKLTVRPMTGDRGVLELSAGKKDVKPLGMVGLLSVDNSMMVLGDLDYPLQAERAKVAKYLLPVGDYRPLMLMVDFGDLQVRLQNDYTRNQSGGIQIRKDKPFVLDLAAKPEVQFQSPPEDKTFKLGEQIRLAAMIRIPDKGLTIGGLQDMSKKTGEMKYMGEDGKLVTAPRYASLDPTVVITDSAGKKVAEGTMPFG